MRDQLLTRLAELNRQYQLGEEQLRELSRQEAALRETLLRIAGAVQVLEELLNPPVAQASPTVTPPAGRHDQESAAGEAGEHETYRPITVP